MGTKFSTFLALEDLVVEDAGSMTRKLGLDNTMDTVIFTSAVDSRFSKAYQMAFLVPPELSASSNAS